MTHTHTHAILLGHMGVLDLLLTNEELQCARAHTAVIWSLMCSAGEREGRKEGREQVREEINRGEKQKERRTERKERRGTDRRRVDMNI